MKIADMEAADAVLLVACNPRHEAPILGHRLRKAWLKGAVISCINPLDWEFVFDTRNKLIAAPQFLVQELACVALAVASASGQELPAALRNLPAQATPEARHVAMAPVCCQPGMDWCSGNLAPPRRSGTAAAFSGLPQQQLCHERTYTAQRWAPGL
jgi:NADH dehydrogenase/NADH:ubiquinone oxidoreductase subunit G